MPWQQYVADVALEVEGQGTTDDPFRLTYGEIGLTVPRQSGKSTFILAKATHRCTATGFFGQRQHVVYTAQTRIKAREKWEEDYAAALNDSPTFRSMARPFKGAGNEHFRFQNGSKWGIDANTESAGHGGTLDEAYIDEAFAQKDGRLEQAFRPAMITRPNTQLLVVSTAGWLGEAPFLWEKTQRGRASLGAPSRLAYFEWSADEDADPFDPATWWSCMPALGHTISEESIRGELDGMKLADFRRAYLNQWVPKPLESDDALIPAESWAACLDELSSAHDPVTFGIDVSPDRSVSTISVAGLTREGRLHLETIDTRPGTEWVPDRIAELVERHRPAAVAVDPAGPAGALLVALERVHLTPVMPTTRELAQTCGRFYDLVVSNELRHRTDPPLDVALAGVRKRSVGDAWAWGRKQATCDITPLYAATLAMWALAEHGTSGDPGVYVI